MTIASQPRSRDYGPRRLTVELTNVCNLHCSYCLRDEDALYHSPANFLPIDLFARIARDARDVMGIEHVMFTGGEPTLHGQFRKILAVVAELSLTCSFVTNGWHFERVWPLVLEHRQAVTHVSFSLDGTSAEAHDRWRGQGSFERVIRALSRCWASNFPFHLKVGIRRDTAPELERFALFAARLGAAGLSFAHLMPTSPGVGDASALTLEERAAADHEIALLARIFNMRIGIDVGYFNIDPAAPCSPLNGVSGNVNYRGQLSLCCNLSGFRGGHGEADIVGDLQDEPFAPALERLRRLAATQSGNRIRALAVLAAAGEAADLGPGFAMSLLPEDTRKDALAAGFTRFLGDTAAMNWRTPMTVNSEDAGTPWLLHEHVIFTDLDDEGVLVDLHARQFYQLNETASLVWRGLVNGRAVVDIVREMTEAYDVTPERAQTSVETVVGRFIAHHWVNRNQANG